MESMNITNWPPGALVIAAIAVIGLIFKCGTWYNSVNSDSRDFKEFMAEMRAALDKIYLRLPRSPLTPGSPLKLTDYGEKISGSVDAKAWAKAEARKLINEVEGKEAFEVQSLAFSYAKEFEPATDFLRKMAICAFENGTDVASVREVMGVELRDSLLEVLESKKTRVAEGTEAYSVTGR